MKGRMSGEVTQGEIDRALSIAMIVKDALAASGGQISLFNVDIDAALKRAGQSVN